jgi:hypothetical protein
VDQQGRAYPTTTDCRFKVDVLAVEAAHETHLDHRSAERLLGNDDVPAVIR